MNTVKNLHPIALLLFFVQITVFSAFNFNPIYLSLSLCGAVLFAVSVQGFKAVLKSLAGYSIMFVLIAVSNPLFSHNGATAIFFINDNRVTLEAFLYGAALGMAVVSVLYWFRCFNEVFDSEKYLYVFGRLSPKLALVLSMTLRFVPELVKGFRSINSVQKCFDSKQGRVRRYLSSFSALITQSLESAVVTSDSMNARGYNLKHRTHYSRFSFKIYDLVFVLIYEILFALTCVGRCSFEFYPTVEFSESGVFSLISVISFGVFAFLPFIFEVREEVKWKLSISKI